MKKENYKIMQSRNPIEKKEAQYQLYPTLTLHQLQKITRSTKGQEIP